MLKFGLYIVYMCILGDLEFVGFLGMYGIYINKILKFDLFLKNLYFYGIKMLRYKYRITDL